MKHESHPNILRRLKQAHGHLATVITMIVSERSCVDLAQQLHAVENAVHSAKRTLIHDHMEHCLGDAAGKGKAPGNAALSEFKALAKYL